MATVQKVNLQEKFGVFQELWDPKIVGQVNDSHVKLVKVKGEFEWHRHEREDELFLVVEGRMTVQLRDHDVPLAEGEFVIVPRGVEHRSVAVEEAHVLLIEPVSTVNTGDMRDARTRSDLERI